MSFPPASVASIFVFVICVQTISFIYIRVVAPALGPILTAEARVSIAGLALLLYAVALKTPLAIRQHWKDYLILGALNSAIPFALISQAEVTLTASMAGILNSTAPLFGVVTGALLLNEPLTARKVVGGCIALTGVVVLVGWSPLPLNQNTLLSIGASLVAASMYGLAGAYMRRKVHGANTLSLAVGNQLGAALLLALLVPFAPLPAPPSTAVILCLLALALLSTSFAYILYFRLIMDVGLSKALTVTFLTPIFGMLWAALFLHEAVTLNKLLGCGIILIGTNFIVRTPVSERL